MLFSEAFREARNVLMERGHNKNGQYRGPDGSVCAYGAVATVTGGEYVCGGLLEKALNSLHPDSKTFVAAWNDAPERTLDEVLELLERAEKLAEEREAS